MITLRKLRRSIPVQYLIVAFCAVTYSFVCEIFVFPNHFAPAGIMGLATLIQSVLGFNIGYLSLIINIPMLAVAFFVVNRKFAMRTLVFVLVNSLTFLLIKYVDAIRLPAYNAGSDTGGALLAAIAAGFFNGLLYSLSVRAGGCTGGTDVVAAFIHRKKPEFNMIWIIFSLNAAVALLSFFVYDMEYRPVLLCVAYVFVNSRVGDAIFRGSRGAIKFEVITTHAEEIAQELFATMRHGCTVMPARGAYTHTDRTMLLCVVNRREIVDFERIIRKYDNTFAYISTVNEIVGHFNRTGKGLEVPEEEDNRENWSE